MKPLLPVPLFALAACRPAGPAPLPANAEMDGTWVRTTAHIDTFEDEGKSVRPWLDSLFADVLSGRSTAYDMEGGEETVLPPEVIRGMLHRVDSMYAEDPATGAFTLQVAEVNIGAKDVSAIGFRERIMFLPGSGLAKSMDAYAPYMAVSDEKGKYMGMRPLFWVKSPTGEPRSH